MDTIQKLVVNGSKIITNLVNGEGSFVNIPEIERSFINPSVRLGYLYDASRDSIKGQLYTDTKSDTKYFFDKASCIMYKGNEIQPENFGKILRIDDETWLSATLGIVEPWGILRIVNDLVSINNLTRFIFYFYRSQEESFIDPFWKKTDLPLQTNRDHTVTHVVTHIKRGIAVLIRLQLAPTDPLVIDNILRHLCSQLTTNGDINYDELLSTGILSTKIYSNIDDLSRLSHLYDFYRQIRIVKQHEEKHRTLNFKMVPINYFYIHRDLTNNIYIPIDKTSTENIVTHLITSSSRMDQLKRKFEGLNTLSLRKHLQQQLDHADRMISDLTNFYLTQVKLFRDWVIAIRSQQEDVVNLLNNKEERLLHKMLDDLAFDLDNLKFKSDFINYLKRKEIDYLNVGNTDINRDDNQTSLENKLAGNDTTLRIFCSADYLKDNDNHQWEQFISEFTEKRNNDEKLHLRYADFSYSSYHLEQPIVLHLKKQNKKKTLTTVEGTSSKTDSAINIILFGESGVGKSTFINALANYLLFENLDQARHGQLVVIIPVSFLMTINDQFEEKLIKFGHLDSNENHNDIGQSVTQQCKSYEFNTPNGQKIRIIDTPGFGDTRGQDQDDKNMNEIISYIQNLDHLNALCILLKPNVKELNPSFRSCFRQMIEHLGDQFSNNILFCFTNSQATFFAPGDTSPVLKQFLQTIQDNKIEFQKKNTFSFDSESFRYLLASQQSIQFQQHYIIQFEQSWLKSVKESNRLIDHITSQEKQYYINHKWISIKREINQLIRPMLEAIRNSCRNISLATDESIKGSIELKPIFMNPSYICYKLDRPYTTFGPIHIMFDEFHESSTECDNQHLTTNYKLHYKFTEKKVDYSSDVLTDYLYGIIKACAGFDSFLNDECQSSNDGPFLCGINRMINEEKSICDQESSNSFNKKLRHRLESSKDQYFKYLNEMKSNDIMESICSRIDGMKALPMIYEQIHPI